MIKVVVAGGRKPENNYLIALSELYPNFYAADKGLSSCLAAGITPKGALGDWDSVLPEDLARAHKLQVPLLSYPRQKDATDLALLLTQIGSSSVLIVSGIWGGRADHLYANLYTLRNFAAVHKAVVLLADEKELLLLAPMGEKIIWQGAKQSLALSLLPFTEVSLVTLRGVKWPLEQYNLELSNPFAISNEESASTVEFICHSGCTGLYLQYGGK